MSLSQDPQRKGSSSGTGGQSAADTQLGTLAVELQLITQEQLDQCLSEQKDSALRGHVARLGQILVQRRLLTATHLAELLTEHRRREHEAVQMQRYEIRERLGEGAQAVVYRAWDRSLNRAVAMKVLRAKGAGNDTLRLRFLREARVAAGLSHTNVIAVHDVGETNGELYLVMELVEGVSLARLMETRALDLRGMVDLLEKAARGVGAAHEKGIVHRDLKPGFILVTAAGEAKVGDFGLAHLVESGSALTNTGARLGTPLYMAPEQVRGSPGEISPRTDVYALGSILYEFLVGRPPFAGETVAEVYTHILQDDPHPPTKANPKADRILEAICLKALEKNPSKRYGDAAELAEELKRYREGKPVEARPPGVGRKTVRWIRRHRAVSAGAVSAAIVVAIAIVVVLAVRTTDSDRHIADLIESAVRAERQGRPAGAAELYEQVLVLKSDHPVARERLAAIRGLTGDPSPAIPPVVSDPQPPSTRGGWRLVERPIDVAWPLLKITAGPVEARMIRRDEALEPANAQEVREALVQAGACHSLLEYVSARAAQADEIRCVTENGRLSALYVRGSEWVDALVHVPEAAPTLEVELGAGVEAVTLAPEGYLELRGKGNVAWLRLSRPVVIDAAGELKGGEILANGVRAIPPAVAGVDLKGRRTVEVTVALPSAEYPLWIGWTWSSTASMAAERSSPGLVRLEDGRVLVACGRNKSNALSSGEVFDPVTSTWSSTGAVPASEARRLPVLTCLRDGKVLLTGGYVPGEPTESPTLDSAFVWDPAGAGAWFSTANRMSSGRAYHSAVLLADGRVLVIGGATTTTFYTADGVISGVSGATASCDLYVASTNSFAPADKMKSFRKWFGAIRLEDNTVLVAGGLLKQAAATEACEIYTADSGAGRWRPAAPLTGPRGMMALVGLPDGRVVRVAGNAGSGGATDCEIFSEGKWFSAAQTPEMRDCFSLSTDLIDRREGIIIQAGGNCNGPTDKVHRYSSATGTWTGPRQGEPSMRMKREFAVGVRIEDGKMLVVGGRPDDGYVAFHRSAEIYEDSQEANARPELPERLEQSELGSGALLADAGVSSEARIKFSAVVGDPDGGQVCLQVDIEPVSRDFDGAGLLTGVPVPSGGKASVTSGELTPGTSYHWRARVIDLKEAAGPWMEFEEGVFERVDVRCGR
ncbi:MAG: protein kinase [Planctomycetes bacterium]|nr:protein kinase [Planctomycetota bacterium]